MSCPRLFLQLGAGQFDDAVGVLQLALLDGEEIGLLLHLLVRLLHFLVGLLELLVGLRELHLLFLQQDFRFAQAVGLGLEFAILLLEHALLVFQLVGQGLRLAQQLFGAHHRGDVLEDDAEVRRQPGDELQLQFGERRQRREFQHGLDLAFKEDGFHHHGDGRGCAPKRSRCGDNPGARRST